MRLLVGSFFVCLSPKMCIYNLFVLLSVSCQYKISNWARFFDNVAIPMNPHEFRFPRTKPRRWYLANFLAWLAESPKVFNWNFIRLLNLRKRQRVGGLSNLEESFVCCISAVCWFEMCGFYGFASSKNETFLITIMCFLKTLMLIEAAFSWFRSVKNA